MQHFVKVDVQFAVCCTISLWQKQQSVLLNLQNAKFKCCASARLCKATCTIMGLKGFMNTSTFLHYLLLSCVSSVFLDGLMWVMMFRNKRSHLFKKRFGNVHIGVFYFTSYHSSVLWHGQSHAQCIVPCVHPCRINIMLTESLQNLTFSPFQIIKSLESLLWEQRLYMDLSPIINWIIWMLKFEYRLMHSSETPSIKMNMVCSANIYFQVSSIENVVFYWSFRELITQSGSVKFRHLNLR